MNTSLLMDRGAQKAACWLCMAGYTLNSVTWQMLSCWCAGPKPCSQKRGACPHCVLVQCQKPQTLSLSYRSCSIISSRVGRSAYKMSSPQPRGGGWLVMDTMGHREQAAVAARSWWKGAHCHSDLYGECVGLTRARNTHGCKRLQRRYCTQCALRSTGVPALCQGVLILTVAYTGEIQCCHHKSQERF